jgi:hypothetical protein
LCKSKGKRKKSEILLKGKSKWKVRGCEQVKASEKGERVL